MTKWKIKWPFTVQINWSSGLKKVASFSRSKEQFFLSTGQNNFGNKVLFFISNLFFSEDEETNTCVISINDEKGQRQNANRKSICTFCLSEVKKKKTVLFKKTCQNTESSAGVTSNIAAAVDWNSKTENSNFIYNCSTMVPSPISYYSTNQNVTQTTHYENLRYH